MPGYAFDITQGQCVKCAIGFWQDDSKQFQCKPCEIGKTTRNEGSTMEADCKGIITV